MRASDVKVKSLKGFDPLDRAIGGLLSGTSYIIFGEAAELVMYSYMIRAAADGRVLYINSTDYYSERNIIDQDLIGRLCKTYGLDVKEVLGNIDEVSAHSPERLVKAAEMHSRPGYSLYVIHGLHSFIKDRDSSDMAFSKVMRDAVRSGAPLIAITRGEDEPIITSFMKSSAGYVIRAWTEEGSVGLEVLKPFRLRTSYGWDEMGRLTRSFRQRYEEYLEFLEKEFAPLLRGGSRRAFERLKAVWSSEMASMSSLQAAQVSDAMVMVAIVRLEEEIEELRKELERMKNERMDI